MKNWESLRFIKQVRVVPQEGKTQSRMYMDLIDDSHEYMDMYISPMTVPRIYDHRQHVLKYGDGWVTHIETDFPEDFKKLVQHFGDYEVAYKVYMSLQKPVKSTWMDEAEGKLNP